MEIILVLLLVHLHSSFGINDSVRNCSCVGLGAGCNFNEIYCSPIDKNCNKENVALGKPIQVGSVYMSNWYRADVLFRVGCTAANGNRNNVFDIQNSNCFRSERFDYRPFWQIDFGRAYTITNITIYASNMQSYRLSSMKIRVDNRDCTQFPDGMTYPSINHVWCETPLTGSTLIMFKEYTPMPDKSKENRNYFLLFCEVEVWVCRSGFYGLNCDSPCPVNCLGCDNYFGHCTTGCISGFFGEECNLKCGQCKDGKCDVNNGTCPSGCSSGWMGNRCDEACGLGFFGIDCTQVCGPCPNGTMCSRITGLCTEGCDTGWQGVFCNETCGHGKWGPNCDASCGKCKMGTTCNVYGGQCPDGCNRGRKSVYCNESCTPGTYGPNCRHRCDNCKRKSECDTLFGSCPGDCVDGFRRPDCNKACLKGTYGLNCMHKCGHCRSNAICDRFTGKCPGACANGWKGPRCNDTCDKGTYGDRCSEKCSFCTNGACDSVTGECQQGCQVGYAGNLCTEDASSDVKSYYFVVGSAIVFAQLGIMTTIWIWKSKQTSEVQLRRLFGFPVDVLLAEYEPQPERYKYVTRREEQSTGSKIESSVDSAFIKQFKLTSDSMEYEEKWSSMHANLPTKGFSRGISINTDVTSDSMEYEGRPTSLGASLHTKGFFSRGISVNTEVPSSSMEYEGRPTSIGASLHTKGFSRGLSVNTAEASLFSGESKSEFEDYSSENW